MHSADTRVSVEAYANVVGAIDSMVGSWRPLLCRACHRECIVPFTATQIGGSEIK